LRQFITHLSLQTLGHGLHFVPNDSLGFPGEISGMSFFRLDTDDLDLGFYLLFNQAAARGTASAPDRNKDDVRAPRAWIAFTLTGLASSGMTTSHWNAEVTAGVGDG